MADLRLKLGDFEFGAYEVPNEIPFGGTQHLVSHELVGGSRVIDAMGAKPQDLSWSGLFYGDAALDRARYLDSLRVAGKPLSLTWMDFSYTVVIESLTCSFMRFYRLPYSITCKVVKDQTQPTTVQVPLSFDAAIMGDFNAAAALAATIGDGPLSGLITVLNSAISAVSDIANTQGAIDSILGPIKDVQSRVQLLIASVSNLITNVTAQAGGLLSSPAGFQARTNNMTELANLYTIDSIVTRMRVNLGLVNSAPNAQTVTVSGGDLYSLAATYYKDANQWTVIAKANNLTDPLIVGVQTLTIPPAKPATNGVPSA